MHYYIKFSMIVGMWMEVFVGVLVWVCVSECLCVSVRVRSVTVVCLCVSQWGCECVWGVWACVCECARVCG